jgi:hypothetical protein
VDHCSRDSIAFNEKFSNDFKKTFNIGVELTQKVNALA